MFFITQECLVTKHNTMLFQGASEAENLATLSQIYWGKVLRQTRETKHEQWQCQELMHGMFAVFCYTSFVPQK